MGVDGSQSIFIRGPKEVLDNLEKNFLAFDNDDKECKQIIHYFFGPKQLTIEHRDDNYLICNTHFRNETIYQYFDKLLEKYPMCWIKNRYSNELGYCGMWIGRYQDGKKFIQELEWEELNYDEIAHLKDFSS
uniref:YubB ferredoxin-like domain-containing protein n=1 Tax=viral metagenome TaxID=1070528 RepID=A0A6C0HEU4_9ZZZZ